MKGDYTCILYIHSNLNVFGIPLCCFMVLCAIDELHCQDIGLQNEDCWDRHNVSSNLKVWYSFMLLYGLCDR